ncbi:DNA replication protein [Aspergillus bombycis]|uniref:DNA replication protein n=1 Tax=Aspergillus bombycis TaxID=109264 RepID=A0A1F7ZIH8_9EURO|nr:DNA replication protein [Aspergillus bombycis]OGM39251.1 DNA replication protein [Aspergillus bombycis]
MTSSEYKILSLSLPRPWTDESRLEVVDISWPPKSPREALLSSPSGRKKYEEMQRRRENFGSPLKRSTTTPELRTRSGQLLEDGLEDEEEDDDDEETLKLKLAAIEARLKLKQLQKNRGKPGTPGPDAHDRDDALSRPGSAVSASSRTQDNFSRMKGARETSSRLEPSEVQVPLSPTRRPAAAAPPASPRRYILGIDKGRKGSDVSLKRPPSSRTTGRPTSGGGIRDGMALHSHNALTQALAGEGTGREATSQQELSVPIRQGRGGRFQGGSEARKGSPTRSPTRHRQTESFSRDDVLRSCNNLKPVGLKRSQTLPSVRRNPDQDEPGSYLHRRNQKSESEAQTASSTSFEHTGSDDTREGSVPDKTPDSSKFEPFSSLHLSNRILPHSFLTRTLADKKVLRIPDLLRTVKGPAFELPETVNGDYVVFGIVASKSEPREIKDSKKVSAKEADPFDEGLNNTSRYMCIQLTDLKWTIDLFLFDTAFPRYYRLSEGILIAILNPTILPPPKHKLDTNKFSLAISSSDDKVLEIGYAQDIGFCKAVRKDGKTCQAWVDGRKTEFCDFHIDIQVRRTQSQRMGVNTGTGMFGPGGRSGPRTGFFGGGKGKGEGPRKGLKPNGAQYDFQSQSVYYVAPAPKSRAGNGSSFVMPGGQSAARLIDADDEDPFIAAGRMGRGMENKEERFRRRLVEQQRERDIAQKLTSRGIGMGAEYLRARNSENVSSPLPENITPAKATPTAETPSSHSGLLGFRKANTVQLGPLKRAHDGTHGNSVKKTRFITAKGIKEAGRDSLGMSEATRTGFDDDDDDELDII